MDRRKILLGSAAAIGAGLAFRMLGEGPRAAATGEGEFEVVKSEEAWREQLTPDQYRVLRKHGTERAWTSPLNGEKREGIYACAGCGQDLFSSETKFDSGTGWPSFYAPIEGAVGTSTDRGFFMTRTEVHCSRCGGHQGHVFEDCPPPTGLRYCINGVALAFRPAEQGAA